MRFLLWAVMLAAISSCGKNPEPAVPETEIGISVLSGPLTRGATIFDGDETLIETAKGGGNMTISAYLTGTNTPYISNERVFYFVDDLTNPWRFRKDEGLTYTFVKHVWPPEGAGLDFFAYMPYSAEVPSYISNIDYDKDTGPTFSCDLPVTKATQDPLKEFIYAYTAGVDKNTASGWAELNFEHPFALIYLRLAQGHRDMTINSITFENIYKAGSFAYSDTPQWTPSGDPDNNLEIPVGKIIPGDLNFGSDIDGPFFVLPQTFAGNTVTISMDTDWEGHVTGEHPGTNMIYTVDVPMPSGWEPGKAYVYTLDMGDIKEEIMFKVIVEAWDIQGYHIPVDVE